MIKYKPKPRECDWRDCEETFTPKRSFDKHCSFNCWSKDQNEKEAKKNKPKRNRIPRSTKIKPVSVKMKRELAKYHKERLVFLSESKNKICPVTFQSTTEIHHKMGRVGFADQWARDNDITLLHDQRYWLAVSRTGHRKIEENPEWAKEHEFSKNRI